MSESSIVQIIVALIAAGIPTLASFHNTKKVKRQANRHACRQSILQLILEDKMAVMEGKAPENYHAILDEFDEYVQNNGNSYIKSKVTEYTKWYEEVTKKGAVMARSKTTKKPRKSCK